jgi:hypothetical protein
VTVLVPLVADPQDVRALRLIASANAGLAEPSAIAGGLQRFHHILANFAATT